MVLAAAESIVDIFSPTRGRGCLTPFKDKWLQEQVCTSYLYFIVTLMPFGTTADHHALRRDFYTLVLLMGQLRSGIRVKT